MVLDLQLRAIEQLVPLSRRPPKVPGIGDDTGAHFSREYMCQVVLEMQQALAAAGRHVAAMRTEELLSSAAPAQEGEHEAATETSAARPRSSVNITGSELLTPTHCWLVHCIGSTAHEVPDCGFA